MLRGERVDCQLSSAMYPRALVKAVSKIPSPSGTLQHQCHSHMYVKVCYFYVLSLSLLVPSYNDELPYIKQLPSLCGCNFIHTNWILK